MSAPDAIYNPPGLSAIQYRCGTFTTFRAAMLDRVADPDLLASAVTALSADCALADTQIDVADAVNFPISEPFRIKIGGEYLTVVAGAGTLSWKVLRGVPPFVHRLGDSVILDPENPFLRWHEAIDSDYHTALIELWAYLGDVLTFYQERIANEAFLGTATQRDSLQRLAALIGYRPTPGAGASGLVSFSVAKGQTVSIPAGFRVGSRALPGKPAVTYETAAALTAIADHNLLTMAAKSPKVPYDFQSVVLQGLNTTLKQNDYLLAVEQEGQNGEATHLLRIDAVMPDPGENFTTIVWHDIAGEYTQATKDISLYSFSVIAAPLGHIAPRWEFLSPVFTNFDGQHPGALFERASWDLPRLIDPILNIQIDNLWYYIPVPGEPGNVLYLDSTYQQLKYSGENPGWAVLVTDGGIFQVLHVSDARPTGRSIYAMSARSTRLTFAEFIDQPLFPLRTTQVLTGVEPLPLAIDLPLPDDVAGASLTIDGVHPQLQAGQKVIVQGDAGAEPAVIAQPVQTDAQDNVTFVQLKAALVNTYTRTTCTMLANVALATQGETVKDEILGSGNATPFQTFALAQNPLTYLPSTDAEGLSAVQSSLLVTVNGIAWTERPTLAASTPDAQEFVTAQDDSSQTTVSFGDGFHGARPPSGANNIHARYRKGLGSSGNLGGGLIQQLIDSTPNLQKVMNPLPATGGSDPETSTQIRTSAPASMRTFGRAVTVADHAALALSYPGIGKASAAWIAADPATGKTLAHPYIQLTAATLDGTPLQGTILATRLRGYLDDHRDPNVLLRLRDYDPVYLNVAVTIQIGDRFPHQATLDQVQAALAALFSFDNLQFGQTIYLIQLYAAIQTIAGVLDSNITALQRLGPAFPDPPFAMPHDVVTGATEIAAINHVAFPGSALTVTGQGGYADQ